MITASHNPAADNGYKLYLEDGAQIVPPVDAEIEARIAALGPLSAIPIGDLDGPLVIRHGDDVLARLPGCRGGALAGASRGGIAPRRLHAPARRGRRRVLRRARAGRLSPPGTSSPSRPSPTPTSPPSPFPNPEEPGALDLALAEASRSGADVVVANDPDGDRLAVAVP